MTGAATIARMPQRRIVLAVSFLTLCSIAAPLRADEAAFREEFRRAELKETAFGELAEAANLYRAAAGKADDAADRAKAELRAGSCLRRLGRMDDATALLAPLLERGDVPEEIRRLHRDLKL